MFLFLESSSWKEVLGEKSEERQSGRELRGRDTREMWQSSSKEFNQRRKNREEMKKKGEKGGKIITLKRGGKKRRNVEEGALKGAQVESGIFKMAEDKQI